MRASVFTAAASAAAVALCSGVSGFLFAPPLAAKVSRGIEHDSIRMLLHLSTKGAPTKRKSSCCSLLTAVRGWFGVGSKVVWS